MPAAMCRDPFRVEYTDEYQKTMMIGSAVLLGLVLVCGVALGAFVIYLIVAG